jgi:hypothetical protein
MTTKPAMSGAELRSTRELLGLSPVWMAHHLQASPRDFDFMERGREPVNQATADKVNALAEEASALVDELIQFHEKCAHKSTMITYKTDADFENAQHDQKVPWANRKPVRWHHHVCARVAEQVDIKIDYAPGCADKP